MGIFEETLCREPPPGARFAYNIYQSPCEDASSEDPISALAGEKLRNDAALAWARAWIAEQARP